MANNNGCGRCGRRVSNNSMGCLGSVRGARWEGYPYYGGGCPDIDGCYENDCCDRRDHRRRGCDPAYGMFVANLPMAVAASGVIPLTGCACRCRNCDASCGMVSVEEKGTYLATYTVRLPEGTALDTTVTLKVDGTPQPTAVTEVRGQGPAAYTAQAIFEADDGAMVSLSTSEAITIADPSVQPLVTMSVMQLD